MHNILYIIHYTHIIHYIYIHTPNPYTLSLSIYIYIHNFTMTSELHGPQVIVRLFLVPHVF